MQLLKQLQPGLHVPNVAESVLQTSVSAVIFAAIVDCKTDTPAVQRHGRNRPTTTSKQAQQRGQIGYVIWPIIILNLSLAWASVECNTDMLLFALGYFDSHFL